MALVSLQESVAEVRRVLRSGGWLGLVWNKVTPLERWEFELAGIDPDLKGTTAHELLVLPLPPAETETASFPWTCEVTPEQFRSYLATNSAIIAMPETERALRLDGSEAIIAKVCHETGRATAPLHHEAFCIRWTPS